MNVHDGGGLRRVGRGHFCRGRRCVPRIGWSSSMRRFFGLAAAASLAALTGCSVTTPVQEGALTAPAEPMPSPARTNSSAAGSAGTPSSSSSTGAKAACEQFNALFASYAAVPASDSGGYEDIYLRAEEAKDTVSGDLRGLFAALSLLALDRSGAAGSGPAQESQDALRDAVFANAGTCTAEGVTLLL
jgi:hypothetical protein